MSDLPPGEVRGHIADARSIVVKIGSSALTDMLTASTGRVWTPFADAPEARMRAGSNVTVVSLVRWARESRRWGLKKTTDRPLSRPPPASVSSRLHTPGDAVRPVPENGGTGCC